MYELMKFYLESDVMIADALLHAAELSEVIGWNLQICVDKACDERFLTIHHRRAILTMLYRHWNESIDISKEIVDGM